VAPETLPAPTLPAAVTQPAQSSPLLGVFVAVGAVLGLVVGFFAFAALVRPSSQPEETIQNTVVDTIPDEEIYVFLDSVDSLTFDRAELVAGVV
jgi:hypothetical protein